MDTERLSIAEAAQRLHVSEKTVRRWIRSGKLAAELEDGPYGQQYWVSTQAVHTAQQLLPVVTVERPNEPQALVLALGQALAERDARLEAELAGIRQEMAELRAELALRRTLAPAPPSVPAPPAETRRPPWWRRWWRRAPLAGEQQHA